MGLDATVRCRCFEEGKLKPGPVSFDDLYIDSDGYLASRKLDAAYKAYGGRRYEARYHELDRAFDNWLEHCCEHEDGEYCDEWVSNWGGCGEFRYLVREAGGEELFPLLSNFLPGGNGGLYPVEKASATLKELNRFTEIIHTAHPEVFYEGKYGTAERLKNLLTASIETGNPIRWC